MWGLMRPCSSRHMLQHSTKSCHGVQGLLHGVLCPFRSRAAIHRSKTSAQPLAAAAATQDAPTQPPAQLSNIYSDPQLYEDAFSYRDIPSEVKFLQAAYKTHCKGSKLNSFLELGCGPAAHTIELAKQQPRLQAMALDQNGAMLKHARSRASQAGVNVDFLEADMATFQLPERQNRLDMVVCLLGTLSHLLDNRTAAAALRAVSAHLRPGGLLVLELAHPGDLFDGSLLLGDTGGEMWEVEKGGRKLLVEWGTELDAFDPVSQVLARTVSISEAAEDGSAGVCLAEEVVEYRQFTLQEVDLLGISAGLEVVSTYGDMRMDVPLDHEEAYRMVVCLTKL